MPFVRLAGISELEPDQGFRVELGDEEAVALIRTGDGDVYDITHMQFFQGDQIRGGGGSDGRRVLAQLLHGEEEALYGDSAYHSKAAQALALAVGLSFFVCQRGTRAKPLSKRQRARNRRYSRLRAIGEHPYLVVKRLWGHAKVRYRGLKKNLAQMYALFGLANLYRVRKHFVAI